MKKRLMTTAICAAMGGAMHAQVPTPESYPKAEREEVYDNHFEQQVHDPYRWLENDTTARVKAWVDAQNAVTNHYLQAIPFRSALTTKLTDLLRYERVSAPFKKNGKYYFFRNDGLQNQSVLYVKDDLNGKERVFLDPNKLSSDGTVALTSVSFSKDGKYCAYGISRSGSDWRELYVMDIATGKLLDDHIRWAKFSSAAWDGNGFYYSAYDAPVEGKEFSNINEYHKVYYHKIGTTQASDRLVYQNQKYPKRFYSSGTSEDERFLFIFESGAGRGNALYLYDEQQPKKGIRPIATDLDFSYSPIETIDNKILILTNYKAPRYRLMVADAAKPEIKNWRELIPEQKDVLEGASVIGGKLVLSYMKDASTHIYIHDVHSGKLLRQVPLPALGSAGLSGKKDDTQAFLTFTSFTFPTSIYSYDMATGERKVYEAPKVNFNPDDYTTEQVFYPSKDGTKIPMFLVYKKGLKRDGTNPIFLYGYGGFNVSLEPSFSTARIPFLQSGGIYAQMNLRGGGEYGEEWHLAGTQLNKQNVFDDCIAAAQYLINEQYTQAGKIALVGGSNGGLLVGAVINQRPDLFGAAVPQVGVMDMLRYHLFTIGWNWAPDYGTAADGPEMYKYLKGYSPLHNIRSGVQYPAVLITTADHDDRVVPAHSFKYAAQLQHTAGATNKKPLLIRIESEAGHGAGKPISKTIAEQADTYSFIMYNLGMTLK